MATTVSSTGRPKLFVFQTDFRLLLPSKSFPHRSPKAYSQNVNPDPANRVKQFK